MTVAWSLSEATALFCTVVVDVGLSLFFFNDTATTEIYTLSLHDALPISETQTSQGFEVYCYVGLLFHQRANIKIF